MANCSFEQNLGRVALDPHEPIIAGSVGQWTLTLTVGGYGIDEGGTIKVARRFASDFEAPQFERPSEQGYTTVTTSGDASLDIRYDAKAHERPWQKCLVIDVRDGFLAPGDTVTLVFGDRRRGSPGIRAQTFVESAHEIRVLVDPTNASLVRRLPSSPAVPIVSGNPVKLVCVLPTRSVANQPIMPFLKGEDKWGNPTPPPPGVTLRWEGGGDAVVSGSDSLTLKSPGTGYVVATADAPHLACRSNPLTAVENPPALNRYWGDLHAQTDSTVGTGTEEEYFAFGRDWACLDFIGHQGNDFQLTNDDWARLRQETEAFHRDGVYVVIPGYEWSANTPAGGDRNVFYRSTGQPIFRSSHWQVPEVPEDAQTPAHPADVLFQRIRDNGEGIVCAHVGGRYSDIRNYFDPETCPLVEVVSCWGVFEWMIWDAFEMGYIVGIMANSDGHKGRPGAEGPGAGQFGIAGGLTCVLAPELTREAVFDALRARRCYGTTGARMDLTFSVNGQPMGSLIEGAESAAVEAAVTGTAPLESFQLFAGRECVQTVRPTAFSADAKSGKIRIRWHGARHRGRGRRLKWDGKIRVEGPRLLGAETFSFDSPVDGITERTDSEVCFRSQTTGDTDGIELTLEPSDGGTLVFSCPEGEWSVPLSELAAVGARKSIPLGELDKAVHFERYPDELTETHLRLNANIPVEPEKLTPLFVKATQTDGEMAWASPVYLR